MTGYTIKSVSEEGTYYLCKNWEKNKTFWKEKEFMTDGDLYKSPSYAVKYLKKVLEKMPGYTTDDFTLVMCQDEQNCFVECAEVKAFNMGDEWEPKFQVVIN